MMNSSPPRRATPVGLANRRFQPVSHLGLQLIPCGMAKAVSYSLESVKMAEEDHPSS
jgi:hypothetical protein